MSVVSKSHLKTLLKITFVAGLLYFLSRKGFISMRETRRAFGNWQDFLPAMAALFITAFLGAVRWQFLLRAQNIEIKWGRVIQLTLIGNFFNIALPGAVSGDFVKAFYVGKEVQGQRARAFGSILFDRVAGLSALVLVAAGSVIFGLPKFQHTALLAGTRVFIVTAALCVVFFYAYLFLVKERRDPMLMLLRALETKVQRATSLVNIYLGLRHYHNHRATVVQVLATSVIIHLMVGWACLHFAAALGEGHLSLLSLYVIVPLGLLVTAVPIAPAGVGTGHAAFLFLFGLLGSSRGADIFTLFALVNILIGAIGGLVYLRFRSFEPGPKLDSLATES